MASYNSAKRYRNSFIQPKQSSDHEQDNFSVSLGGKSSFNDDFSVGPENRAKTAQLANLAMSDNESQTNSNKINIEDDSPFEFPFDEQNDSGSSVNIEPSQSRQRDSPFNSSPQPIDASYNQTESTPLLYPITSHQSSSSTASPTNNIDSLSHLTHNVKIFSFNFLNLIPAVILGLMLNVLDGVSYGLIAFPPGKTFEGFGGDGVSMFFFTCIISQLVFTSGGSVFRGANGSMIIETVPFFHILVDIIETHIGENNSHELVATTMVAFALSSIFIGITFYLLGKMRLGALIGFFPRHILVGSIGGVGVFLLETGLEITAGLNNDGFRYTWGTFSYLFTNARIFCQWFPALGLAAILKILTHFNSHPMITPIFFIAVPIMFYIIVLSADIPLDKLRKLNWLFDVGEGAQVPWYRFYSYFDFKAVSWKALLQTLPTQLALVFFGILHVPLNVPALSVSLDNLDVNKDHDVDLDNELIGHGQSNLLAGLLGTFPNYLVYSNSILFYRSGGGSALSGYMLAGATIGVILLGPGAISFVPVMAVGTLIFVLGIDLAKEAVWDTYGKVNRLEYLTIWAIVISMTLLDFVWGVIIGIVLACLFFVVQNARRRPIRAVFNGQSLKSTVRRHAIQRSFLHRIGKQTQIIRLQGFLFFGTISVVEDMAKHMLETAQWEKNPLRFVILDFSLVTGVDFSAAESFVRIARILNARDVTLVLCGIESPDSTVGIALRSVGCWSDREEVRLEVAKDLNDALEYVENAYLRGLYSHPANYQKFQALATTGGVDFPNRHDRKMAFRFSESFAGSPRRAILQDAANSTEENHQGHLRTQSEALDSIDPVAVEDNNTPQKSLISPSYTRTSSSVGEETPRARSYANNLSYARNEQPQPLSLIIGTFKSYTEAQLDFFKQLAPYFTRLQLAPGEILWKQGDKPNGWYLIEKGILKASYQFDGHNTPVDETMLTGTVAGEISGISGSLRNCTVVVEHQATLWHLSASSMHRLEQNRPEISREVVRVLLKLGFEATFSLTSHLAASLA